MPPAMIPHMLSATGSWDLGWEALVAIMTGVLAVMTGVLAVMTWRLARQTAREVKYSGQHLEQSKKQVEASNLLAETAQTTLEAQIQQVEASNRLAETAQTTLEAQIRPVLIDMPLDLPAGPVETAVYPGARSEALMLHPGEVYVGVWNFGEATDETMVSIPIRNAGVGLAMIRGVEMWFPTPCPPSQIAIDPANLAPGEAGRVLVRAARGEPAFDQMNNVLLSGSFSLRVLFSDIAGQRLFLTRFDVHRQNGFLDGWIVRQVHFEDPETREPFAGSAPVA